MISGKGKARMMPTGTSPSEPDCDDSEMKQRTPRKRSHSQAVDSDMEYQVITKRLRTGTISTSFTVRQGQTFTKAL